MNKKSVSRLPMLPVVLLLIIITSGVCTGQRNVPLLERTVSAEFDREPMQAVLKRIGQLANVNFSYKSSLVDEKQLVTAQFTGKTVREILDYLFKGEIDYKERGKYVILVKSNKKATSSSVISGYVIDEATGQRLKNVSVYDPVSLSSAVTDSYGYFQIEIKRPTADEVKLAVRKTQYADTYFVVPSRNRRLVNIPIKIDRERVNVMADSVSNKLKRLWYQTKLATQQAINMENISDTMYRSTQFAFAPFIGTNGKLSGNVINDYSLNVLGGYSLGNRKVEIGGLFNAIRGNVTGVQIAGLANGALGSQRGVQLAGLVNATGDSATGVQIAGLSNIHFSRKRGVALAGVANVALEQSDGAAVAGVGNIAAQAHRGVQVGGIFNVSGGDVGPAQFAGLFNFGAGSLKGAQVAGLFNFTGKDLTGAQVGGLFNIAPHELKGVQIAGIFNVAKNMKGTQLGLFNYASSIKGVPVGLLSIVAKGYHKLEVSADEIFYTNIAYRTGVRAFYNIITVGAKPDTFDEEETFWSFGYGVGTAPRLSKWLSLNFDVTSSQIVKGTLEKINLLNKIYGGFDFHLTKNFSVIAGVTLNGHVTKLGYEGYPELFSDYEPTLIADRTVRDDLNLKMWWGGKIGVRFF